MIEDIEDFLTKHNLDILALTETDFPTARQAKDFKIRNFLTYFPACTKEKVRSVICVKSSLEKYVKTRSDLMTTSLFPTIWIELNLPQSPKYLLGSTYREWGNDEEKTIDKQIERIDSLEDQLGKAVKGKAAICFAGDWNLDASRSEDPEWPLKNVDTYLRSLFSSVGLHRVRVGATFSYNKMNELRTSELDYFFVE